MIKYPDQPKQSSNLTLDSFLTMPLVKVITAASVLLTVGWVAREYLQAIRDGISGATEAIKSVKEEVQRMRLEAYTRTDHRLWSYELEKVNSGRIIVPVMSIDRQTPAASASARREDQ